MTRGGTRKGTRLRGEPVSWAVENETDGGVFDLVRVPVQTCLCTETIDPKDSRSILYA